MPKIANLRNPQGADSDAHARGFISKFELGSQYTQHSGAGTLTPKWVTAGFFMGWSRGFSEGVEEFLKLCFYPNMGLSVLCLGFCGFSCKVQLLFTGA